MREALAEAERAFAQDEVPVGAVAVQEGVVIARGHNRREQKQDPLSHAEMEVLTTAAKSVGSWRLNDITLYVTLEPCAMCSGAMVQARLYRCVFGCKDPKAGVAGSILGSEVILQNPLFNHRVQVTGGVLAKYCSEILNRFFENLRGATLGNDA